MIYRVLSDNYYPPSDDSFIMILFNPMLEKEISLNPNETI